MSQWPQLTLTRRAWRTCRVLSSCFQAACGSVLRCALVVAAVAKYGSDDAAASAGKSVYSSVVSLPLRSLVVVGDRRGRIEQ